MNTLIKLQNTDMHMERWLKNHPLVFNRWLRLTMSIVIVCLLFVGGTSVLAQPYYNELPEFLNANKVWAFASHGGLNFNSGAPVPIHTSIPRDRGRAGEGASAVSDPTTGDLLFYSDGVQCWNSEGDVMLNGDSLFGNASNYWSRGTGGSNTVQGASIVAAPGEDGKYYLFSLNNQGSIGSGSLFYNVVDMRLDSGRGGIVPGQKNILLDSTTLSEAMIAVPGNNCDVWLMVHTFEASNPQNAYKAYHITGAGINPVPVISFGKINLSLGSMSISPDRMRIASGSIMSLLGAGGAEVGRFDPNTGMVSDVIQIADASGLVGPHASAFSPDNSKLYYNYSGNPTPGASLTQYDISVFDSLAVANSKQIVSSVSCGALRLYNGAIYVGGRGASDPFIGRVLQPNRAGLACEFEDSAIAMPPAMFPQYTLGTETVAAFKPDTSYTLVLDTAICSNSSNDWLLEPVMVSSEYTYIWNDNSTDVTRPISEAGTYWVRYSNSCHTFIDTFRILDAGPVPPVIRVNEFELSTPMAYAYYQWLFNGEAIPGATNGSYTVLENGYYQVIVGNEAGCLDTSEVYEVTNVHIENLSSLMAQIRVFPNPARDEVQIQSPVPVRLRLLSLEGKLLISDVEGHSLALKGLSAGLYLLQVSDREGRHLKTLKLMKE